MNNTVSSGACKVFAVEHYFSEVDIDIKETAPVDYDAIQGFSGDQEAWEELLAERGLSITEPYADCGADWLKTEVRVLYWRAMRLASSTRSAVCNELAGHIRAKGAEV